MQKDLEDKFRRIAGREVQMKMQVRRLNGKKSILSAFLSILMDHAIQNSNFEPRWSSNFSLSDKDKKIH